MKATLPVAGVETLLDRSALARYALAVGLTLIALLLRLAFSPILHEEAPLLIFTLPVVVGAWYGGFGPGLLATALSILLGSAFFIPSHGLFLFEKASDYVRLGIFLTESVLVSVLSAQLHSTNERRTSHLVELEAARDQSELERSRLEAVLELLPVGVYITDAQGAITTVNPKGREIWGADLPFVTSTEQYQEFRGWWRATGERIRVDEWAVVRALQHKETAYNEELTIQAFDGERRVILNSAAPLCDATEKVIGAVAINVDISERVAAEEERRCLYEAAQAALRERDVFLSVASHELKTPITSLRLSALSLLRLLDNGRTPAPERLRRALDTVDTQSIKLTAMVNQLLDLSRIESGRLVLQCRRTNLATLIRDMTAVLEATTTHHRLEVVARETVEAIVDPLRMEQVIANLVTNAIKYSFENGTVELALSEAGTTGVVLSVTDHGVGIPEERRAHIFDRFYQAHGDGYLGGMGLGLYISRQIVELHGGSICAEYPEEGGVRMLVRLPRWGAEAGSSPEKGRE